MSPPLRVAYISHCLLNANAKVDELAKVPGGWPPIVRELRAGGYQIRQMPCPELGHEGLHRFWAVREQYDRPSFRRHCERLVEPLVELIQAESAAGAEVVIVGLDGSPSDGVRVTSSGPDWGGRPDKPTDADYQIVPGEGAFIDVLRRALEAAGIPDVRAIGIAQDDPAYDETVAVAELQAFLLPQPVRRGSHEG